MQKIRCKLTVFFDQPFWVCVYERIMDGKMEVCKITFGAEPKDYEVYAFLLENWHRLRFSSPVKVETESDRKTNPKRLQRSITKQMQAFGVGTKAQQALKAQQAEGKEARKRLSRAEREREKLRLFAIRQEKKKQKKRGH